MTIPLIAYSSNCIFQYIRARAVPSQDLKAVRNLLESEGYAKRQEWFADKNKHLGSIGKHSLLIAFAGKQLAYKYFDSA
jgi:hypothetical protein